MLDGSKSLEAIKELVDKPKPKYWERLKDATGSMDVSQVAWVMNQEAVNKSYEAMMKSFNTYLFERFKEDFAAVPTFQPVVDNYINTVINSAQDYGQHAKELEEENLRLRQKLEELMKNAN